MAAKKVKPKKLKLIDDDGNESVQVLVYVNRRLVISRTAVISGEKGPKDRNYKVDNSKTITDDRSGGYAKIAKKLL